MHTSPTNAHRHGFTLAELSIVLVIIGLLVGSIVALRSYTTNARLTNMMNESKFYISAFNQFQTRYNAPPGDYNNATSTWSGTNNGDGNGLIRAGTVAAPLERYYAFQHLALGGFIQGTYSGAVNGNGGASIGLNVPGSSVDKVAFMFDHPDETDGIVNNATTANTVYFDGTYGNILVVAGLNDNSAGTPSVTFLTGKQAYQIDSKFDDGMPGLGNVLAPKQSTLANCASGNTTAATYTTTGTAAVCYLFIKMP